MGIGEDIKKDILSGEGIAITIVRDSGNITGEYIDADVSGHKHTPFIAEFLKSCMLSYDTVAIPGDIVKFNVSNEYHILMNKNPEILENEIISYGGVLYKCNISGELKRPSGESEWDDQTYHKQTIFETIKGNCYCLVTTSQSRHELESEQDVADIGLEVHELYIPSSVGVKVLDRFEVASGEYYKVKTIKKRRYSGAIVCELEEDLR